MSSTFGYLDIILLAMLAGFIILRLRNILGRKSGHHKKPSNKYFPKGLAVNEDIENNEAIKTGNIDENAKKQFLKGAEIAYEQIITFFANLQTSLTVFIVSGFPSIIWLFLSFTQVIISLTKFTVTL